MELTLSKQPVSVMETLYDGVVEQPLECDVLLPDHCPDIQKILRCEVTLALLSWNIQGERATLDGIAAAHLYYTDEQGILRHAEYKIPYSKTLELRSEPVKPAVDITQSVDYFNCRAVSPRRLDMRGAASIHCRVIGQNEEQVVCGAQGMGAQLRQETVDMVHLLPSSPSRTDLHEEAELGYGKPPIGEVIRLSASARVTDYKVVPGKIVLKGEATVHILYRCDEDETLLETMEYTLPVSQVVDVDGLDEDCDCTVWYEICDAAAQPKRSDTGENTLLALDVSLNAMAQICKRTPLEAACACYSTEYECRQEQKQIPFLEALGPVSEPYTVKETMDAGSVKAVVDVWCVSGPVTTHNEADAVTVSGKMLFCMLARNQDGELFYSEQPKEYTKRLALPRTCDNVQFSPKTQADGASYTMSGPQIEIRCNVQISGEMYGRRNKQLLCGIEIDPSRKKERSNNMLYLYFTAGQESLWDVAKRYNTSVEAIQKCNAAENLASGEKNMLLIPMQ